MERIAACETCGLVQRVPTLPARSVAKCARCDETLLRRIPNSRARTGALALAALILYVPANAYPILRMDYLGNYSENTIWDGTVALFKSGDIAVAVVVFLASLLFPLLKLLGLFFLVLTAKSVSRQADRTRVHRFISWIGPWAMLDVFLVAVLVSLVKVGRMATVLPGPGLVCFTAVVVLTIFASASFDSRLIWDEPHEVQ